MALRRLEEHEPGERQDPTRHAQPAGGGEYPAPTAASPNRLHAGGRFKPRGIEPHHLGGNGCQGSNIALPFRQVDTNQGRILERLPDRQHPFPGSLGAIVNLLGKHDRRPVQDGTDLNFATHHGCDGLGVISSNGRKGSGTLGIHMHGTLAVSDRGIPLGVPRIEFDCPEGGSERGKPPEERKSARWLRGWRDGSLLAAEANAVKGRADGVGVVSVMDREGDIAALFVEQRDRGGADILVRARADRVLADGERLFAEVRASAPRSRHEIRVDRASARRAARGQKAFAGREARRAAVELRWLDLSVPVPRKERGRLGSEPVPLTAVHALEPSPPSGAEALEWLLLTTLPVGSADEARRVLDLYALRWRIEDWHRILKSGCEIEKSGFRTAEGRRDLLEIAEQQYGRKSILIASQIPVDRWPRVIGEPTIADAVLDRIVHNAYRIELKGESQRKRNRPPPLNGGGA